MPPANGIDFRILNGYAYLTPVPAPEADIEARVANFMDRAGFYFMNWNDLYDKWMIKIRDLVKELETIDFGPLPELEDVLRPTYGVIVFLEIWFYYRADFIDRYRTSGPVGKSIYRVLLL